jgi:hypothetical protein
MNLLKKNLSNNRLHLVKEPNGELSVCWFSSSVLGDFCFCVFLRGRGGKGFFWLCSLDIARVELFKFCFLKRIYVQEWVR